LKVTRKRSAREPSVLMPSADALRRVAAAWESDEPGASMSIRPSTFLDGKYDDKYGAHLSADTRHAIEQRGKVTRTTTWAFQRGLTRWEELDEVDAYAEPRRKLLARGSEDIERLDGWRVRLRGGKRWTMRYVSEKNRGRCSDLARTLGVGAETMAGLAVMAGVLDAVGIPLPLNQRLARDLAEVLRELRERVRMARRLAGLDKQLSGERRMLTTWEELVDAKRKLARNL